MILVFSTWKNFSSQFFDLDIENPLGGGTLKSNHPCKQIQVIIRGKLGKKMAEFENNGLGVEHKDDCCSAPLFRCLRCRFFPATR
jgi:hypothetical protein